MSTNRHGVAAGSIDIPNRAKLDRYSVEVLRKDGVVLARQFLHVDDFVPLTIETTITTASASWNFVKPLSVTVAGSYYSGGGAGGLKGKLNAALRATRQIEGLDGFVFGQADIADATTRMEERNFVLDGEGRFVGDLNAEDFPDLPIGLISLEVEADIFDIGGRANPTRTVIPVNNNNSYVGIRSLFGSRLDDGQIPSFRLATFDRAGTVRPSGNLDYRLVRLNFRYDWYYRDGWRWRRHLVSDDFIEGGTAQFGPLEISTPLSWGQYALVVENDSGFVSEFRFSVGWNGDGGPVTEPSELQVHFEPGDGGRGLLRTKLPFDGLLRVQTAGADIIETQTRYFPKGDFELPLNIPADEEPGINVLVTLIRPVARGSEHLPQVAIGRTWIPILADDRSLALDISADKRLRSSEPIEVAVDIGADASVQLFLVDEGIHALTGFQNADPVHHFFGERAVSIGFATNYGRLIRQDDSLEAIAVGGDDWLALARAAQKSDFFKTVVASSPLMHSPEGRVKFVFDPRRNGRPVAVGGAGRVGLRCRYGGTGNYHSRPG